MTKLESLQDIFKSRAFVIPDYQRGYAWETEQRDDLLNDLDDLEQMSAGKAHYTGTLVLHTGKHSPRNIKGQKFDLLDIVDGQQRLTTLVILLHCLIAKLQTLNHPEANETAEALREEYICRSSASQGNLDRLTLNGGTAPFFRDYILGDQAHADTTLPAHVNLQNAKSEFSAYLNKKTSAFTNAADQLQWLLAFSGRITNRLGFVVYEVSDEAEVGVMFEVMNARGRPLTQLEMVKNYLLYLGSRVSQPEALAALSQDVNHTWNAVLTAITDAGPGAGEDQFLRYHWAIYPGAEWYEDGKRSRTFDIHRYLKETLNLRHGKTPAQLHQGIKDYLSSLRTLAISYRDVLNPRHSQAFQFVSAKRNELLDRALTLKRVGRTATVLPILMAAHHKFGDDPVGLLELFRLAEVLVFRLSAVERNASTGDTYAYTLAAEIMAGSTDADAAKAKISGMINYYCSDAYLRSALENPERNFYAWSGLKFFLYEYERHLVAQAKQKFAIDWEQFFKRQKEDTIEHILPQGDNTLSVDYWAKRFSPEAFVACRNRLGNLCLTDWNSYYSNKPFPDKRGSEQSGTSDKVYRNSRWHTERELANLSEWAQQAITERQKRLTDFALSRWKV